MNTRTTLLLALLAAALIITGCQSPDVYYWGHYEDMVYASYTKPDKAPVDKQILVMEEDTHKAASTNKPLPPGFHAHLGYLYYQVGKTDAARQEFIAEKTQFPESAIFVDRMLTNLPSK